MKGPSRAAGDGTSLTLSIGSEADVQCYEIGPRDQSKMSRYGWNHDRFGVYWDPDQDLDRAFSRGSARRTHDPPTSALSRNSCFASCQVPGSMRTILASTVRQPCRPALMCPTCQGQSSISPGWRQSGPGRSDAVGGVLRLAQLSPGVILGNNTGICHWSCREHIQGSSSLMSRH